MPRALARFFVWVALTACPLTAAWAADADRIIHGGSIVTVNPAQATAEAVAITAGRITAVGTKADVMRHAGPATQITDLAGRTLVPGFVDGHSHFFTCVNVQTEALCASPPAGPCRSVADVIGQLQKLRENRSIPPGAFISGYGYDPDLLAEKRSPTKQELDSAFPDHPVMIVHVSGHGAILNSRALAKFGITAATPTPPGGVIGREPGSQEPSGLLFETAFLPVFEKLPGPTPDEQLQLIATGQQLYARAGITTAQEGATTKEQLDVLRIAADRGLLELDVIALALITEIDRIFPGRLPTTDADYRGRLRIGGVKMLMDGSPQGRTAFFTTPYLTGGPTGQKDWCGEPTFPQAMLNDMVKKVYDGGAQLFVHVNGDAAIDALLEAHRAAAGDDPARDRGTVGIHSQFIRHDQLQKYRAWHITPSFFTLHCFYFGDVHVANRGAAQTDFISPMKTARSLGLRPSNHTDFNVSPLNQLFTIHTAVNRVSRSGRVIGADERISPLEALEAITIDGARQHREHDRKGSIEVGKVADLVILSGNPLAVPADTIKDIHVVETIKEGRTIWPRPASP